MSTAHVQLGPYSFCRWALVCTQILQAATVSSPPPPPPSGGYSGFQEQVTVFQNTYFGEFHSIKPQAKAAQQSCLLGRVQMSYGVLTKLIACLSCMLLCRCTSTTATLVSVSAVILPGPAQPQTTLS